MTITDPHSAAARPTALLSVDFEDWHQLVRRRLGVSGWERPGPALERQTETLLGLLGELGARATFFILGMTARAHPELVGRIVSAGHEIACHGDAHRPVSAQTPTEFGADLTAAQETIEALTGRTPRGYRAPAFSITRQVGWAYDVLADHGFRYDASQHDSPRIRDRVAPASAAPHRLELSGGQSLWEFPAAVWRVRGAPVPVGGASYWGVMPRAAVLRGLEYAGPLPGLYLHPHELDPQPLSVALDGRTGVSRRLHGALRSAQRNLARRAAPGVLRAIAGRFELIPYGEAHARLSDGTAARP